MDGLNSGNPVRRRTFAVFLLTAGAPSDLVASWSWYVALSTRWLEPSPEPRAVVGAEWLLVLAPVLAAAIALAGGLATLRNPTRGRTLLRLGFSTTCLVLVATFWAVAYFLVLTGVGAVIAHGYRQRLMAEERASRHQAA